MNKRLRNAISYFAWATAIITLSALHVEAQQTGAWREAFQSSPASYVPAAPEFLTRISEQYKVPVKIIEDSLTPKQVTGTLRFRFAVSAGGSQVRIRLSNEEGKKPLMIASASLGIAAKGFEAVPGSLKPLNFGGRRAITIAPGALVISDPINLETVFGTELLASIFAPGNVEIDPRGGAVLALAETDQTLREVLTPMTTRPARPLITGAEVFSPAPPRVIVAFGDSITDGNRANPSALRGWPAELAQRLNALTDGPR
ncbi:MAG: hypothetical protein ABSF53_02090, partial [Terracidiphilus sp.]